MFYFDVNNISISRQTGFDACKYLVERLDFSQFKRSPGGVVIVRHCTR